MKHYIQVYIIMNLKIIQCGVIENENENDPSELFFRINRDYTSDQGA